MQAISGKRAYWGRVITGRPVFGEGAKNVWIQVTERRNEYNGMESHAGICRKKMACKYGTVANSLSYSV